MAKLSYALETGGEKRLTISWKGVYKDVTVALDGNVVGVIPNQKALTAGQEFSLPDGSTLKVQLVSKVMSTELQVHRNGQPLPGSVADPQSRLKAAYGIIYFVAGLNMILGLVSVLFNIEFLYEIGVSLYSIFFGLAFLVMGFFVQRKSVFVLILAIFIFAFDGILGVILTAAQGYTPGMGGVFARIILIIPMFQGIGAIKALKAKEKQSSEILQKRTLIAKEVARHWRSNQINKF